MKASIAVTASFALQAYAQIYTLSATIPWTPKRAVSVDQSQIYNNTYYLSDRTNGGIQVVNLLTKTQTALVGGFVTTRVNGSISTIASGPAGLVLLPDRNQIWAGDGDGSIKVIDLFTNTVIKSIPTGAKNRADEGAYNPTTGVVVMTAADDNPPFVALINATTYSVIGNISFPDAEGIEQPAYNPADGNFYLSIPSETGHYGGAVAVVPSNGGTNVISTLGTPECANAGIAFGAPNQLFVSCDALQLSTFNISRSFIYDVTSGARVANVSGVSGSDQAIYSSKTGYFYASAYQERTNGVPTPNLAVIGSDGTVLQKITTDNTTAHSVAVNSQDGSVVVPVSAKGILVYKLTGSNTTSTAAPTGTGSSSPSNTVTGPSSTFTGGSSAMAANGALVIGGAIAVAMLL